MLSLSLFYQANPTATTSTGGNSTGSPGGIVGANASGMTGAGVPKNAGATMKPTSGSDEPDYPSTASGPGVPLPSTALVANKTAKPAPKNKI